MYRSDCRVRLSSEFINFLPPGYLKCMRSRDQHFPKFDVSEVWPGKIWSGFYSDIKAIILLDIVHWAITIQVWNCACIERLGSRLHPNTPVDLACRDSFAGGKRVRINPTI